MSSFIPTSVESILSRLTQHGYKAYLVGGCVRDYIAGIPPHDFDVTTSATPDKILAVFHDAKTVPTGISHGTVTVIMNNTSVEVTTFRCDGDYSDHRRPDSVTFSTEYRDDAARRDFTMNAIAYNNEEGIVDPFGGAEDIKQGIIRAVGDPYKRFDEDALRILRAVRFASVLGFEIEGNTSNAIHELCHLLSDVSAERISSELTKLLCGKNVIKILTEYSDVISTVIPEITPMIGFCQHNPHHIYDVWEHTVHTVDSIKPVPYLRLAALFHDVGKPSTFSIQSDGLGHFYGHSAAGCTIAEGIIKRLKLPNDIRDKVLTIIKYHDLQIPAEKSSVMKFMRRHGSDTLTDLIEMFKADNLALSPEFHSRQQHYDRLAELMQEILNEDACFSLKDLAVNGKDLIALGVKEGKQIGALLNLLLDKVIASQLPNSKDALLEYVTSQLNGESR